MKRSFVLAFAAAALIGAHAPGASASELALVIKEYDLPTPNGRPHDPARSADGALWYTAQRANKLGRLDPATGDTDYARGYLGRLDPKTGKVEEWPSPGGPRSRPYGIAVAPDGVVWYSESGVEPNTIVRFDPKTRDFAREDIPSGGGIVRNLVATPDFKLYLACSGVNKVAIVELR
jgi:virginiamycin B lyase